VLDSLENMLETAETVVQYAERLFLKHPIIITSRINHGFVKKSLKIDGLLEDDATAMIDHLLTTHKIEAKLTHNHKLEIATYTKGMPLAIELIVAQLRQHTLSDIFDFLSTAVQLINEDTKNPYVDFYRYLYDKSWILLSKPAQS